MEKEFTKGEQPNEQHLLHNMFGLGIEGEIRDKLYTITTWSRITAITGFINLVLNLLITFVKYSSLRGFGNSSWAMITTIVSLAVSFFLNFFLLKFSSHLRTSLDADDQESFTAAAMQLKAYMRMLGILLIITIVAGILTSGFLVMMGVRF